MSETQPLDPGLAGAAPAAPRSTATLLVQVALDGRAAGPSVASGFPSLDALLGGGFRRGDLVVLAGDAGVGKSALALAIALRSVAGGAGAAFLSGEMSVPRIIERALAIEGRTRIDDIRKGDADDAAHAAVIPAALSLRNRLPVIDTLGDGGIASVSDLLVEHLGLDLVIVDPVQCLVPGRLAFDDEVATAARALKELALRRSAAVIAVTQLTTSPRGRPDPRPRLEDLGGLGTLRQHADVVLGLFREELYDPNPHTEGAAELHVLKNRNGPGGFIDLYFYKQWVRFEDMVEPDR